MNKKGLEMSVGLIVLLIISVLIFSLSIYLVFKWFAGAEQLKAEIDKRTQEQIQDALRSGNNLVAIPISLREVKRGTSAAFGIGVRNVVETKQFSAAIAFSDAYDPQGKRIPYERSYITEKWLGSFDTIPTFILRKNEDAVQPLVIKADVNVAPNVPTQIGDYTFNVCVFDKPLDPNGLPYAPCDAGQYKNNPSAFYTQRIYQVVVRVG